MNYTALVLVLITATSVLILRAIASTKKELKNEMKEIKEEIENLHRLLKAG